MVVCRKVNYWIFIVTGQKVGKDTCSARDLFEQRMKDAFWGLGEKTPNRRNIKSGDKVVFYIGAPEQAFAGSALLVTSSFKLNENQKRKYHHDNKFYTSEYGVEIEKIDVWSNPKPIVELIADLDFIENKPFWYAYFQGGIRQITEELFFFITSNIKRTLVEKLSSEKDLENQAEFALESHLEEFIYCNWNSINWGIDLEIYKIEEQDGRQFPAGMWNIDFLAIDKDTEEYVVIELKKGKTSDAVVGQILRYMSWVKENIDHAINVKGIIIAKEVDDALRYAIKDLPQVQVKTYKVDFHLLS